MNPPPRPPAAPRAQTVANPISRQERNDSSSSDSSSSSQVTAVSNARPAPYVQGGVRAVTSTTSLASSARPLHRVASDLPLRHQSPAVPPISLHQRHRSRQHSQGFFEPTLPKTSITASIAAQAAMHIQSKHHRRRSQTIPDRVPKDSHVLKKKPSYLAPIQTSQHSASSLNVAQSRAIVSNGRMSAASQVNSMYARSPPTSPDTPFDSRAMSPTSPGQKPKENPMMKLFSKPKNTYREIEKKVQISPSKDSTKSATFPRMMNYSTTTLNSPAMSSANSMYSSVNGSTSTLVPGDRTAVLEKEKHKHNFLSRQKQKLKEGSDHHHLMLSSASSNSRPTDPNAPQSLYSFAPSSPAPGSAFNKSISGLDLRHGGRALREKKREEKATASGFVPPIPSSTMVSDSILRDREHAMGTNPDWLGPASGSHTFGPPSASSVFFPISDLGLPNQGFSGLGLPGMTQDDAWPLLKARLLNIFEGEDIRTPIEDFNRLVTAHLQRCIQRRAPGIIVEDLQDLLHTGFTSLDLTLRQVPDDRLVPHLVGTWVFVFDTILPFMQAVFLPLEHEFKARNSMLGSRDLADFWGLAFNVAKTPTSAKSLSPATPKASSHLAIPLEALSVRSLVLVTFRDVVVEPRHETLLSIFSHLSLDSINFDTGLESRHYTNVPQRPGTSASYTSGGYPSFEPASVTSQSSTSFDAAMASGSMGARSRATSNTSAGSFHSINSSSAARQRQPQISRPHVQSAQGYRPVVDSAKITQTAARMLQCVSVLAGLPGPGYMPTGSKFTIPEEGDPEVIARKKMDQLAKELKLNWLGRGRMGRNRMGFVGGKMRTPISMGLTVGVAS